MELGIHGNRIRAIKIIIYMKGASLSDHEDKLQGAMSETLSNFNNYAKI